MKRAILTAFLALVFGAMWQALANHLPSWLNLFFLPPVVLVFILQFYRPLETIQSCLLCGFVVDVMSGMAIGSNMILMLIMTFVLGVVNVFSGRHARRELIFYCMAVSFLYRLITLAAGAIILGSKANFLLFQLLLGPVVDGLIGVVFYKLLVAVLSLFKLFDQSDFYSNRLELRR